MSSYDFSNLDFDELKQHLIDYIKESDEFKDYPFEGSALNSIAGLLAYVTLHNNYYLNMTTQELYLNTVTLYRNAVALSKSLNYNPHRRISAIHNVDISVDPEVSISSSSFPILIPQNCLFDVEGSIFTAESSYNITDSSSTESIILRQREIINESFTYNGNQIVLRHGYDVDEDLLTVTVEGTPWTKYENDITADRNSEVFFVSTNLDEKLVITFGDNTVGLKPDIGATIDIRYGITEGANGNNLSETELNQIVVGADNTEFDNSFFVISTDSLSSGGVDKETLDSIKINAPKFYETQNRAVTPQDYQTILGAVPFVDILSVWDGADEAPPTYGTVFASFKPVAGDVLLTQNEKQEIQNYIKTYMPVSITLRIVDPVYIYINLVSKIFYFESFNQSTSAIKSEIQENINNFFSNQISAYDTKLKYSSLLSAIDSVDEVSNNLTDIVLNIKFDKTFLDSNAYSFSLGNEIEPNSITSEYIEDDGNGNIIDKDTEESIGTIDYSTGELNFISDKMDETDNILYFKTAIRDIYFEKNIMPIVGTTTFTFEGV
jgi:hypothetical protein